MITQVLRYANVYGPRQSPLGEAGVFAIFTAKMLQGQVPLIHGSGKQTRDFVFVEDVVAANVLALEHAKPCLFNVGTGTETDIVTVFQRLKKIIGFEGDAIFDQAKEGESMRSCIDSRGIERAWKWKPRVSIAKGLEKTVQWFKKVKGKPACV